MISVLYRTVSMKKARPARDNMEGAAAMSRADEIFIQTCKDILSKGTWDTDLQVRPRWEDAYN